MLWETKGTEAVRMVGDEKMITADGTELIVVKSSEEIREENLQRLAGFRIMDDTFARSVFKENPKLAEFVCMP